MLTSSANCNLVIVNRELYFWFRVFKLLILLFYGQAHTFKFVLAIFAFWYIRMTPERFGHLLSLVGPRITKTNTRMREAISAAERLTLTLRYLASGDDKQNLSFSYRIGRTTVSHIIKETLYAIWLALKDKYVGPPKSACNWKNISNDFESTWHLPHCIGAIDGKHIAMQCP